MQKESCLRKKMYCLPKWGYHAKEKYVEMNSLSPSRNMIFRLFSSYVILFHSLIVILPQPCLCQTYAQSKSLEDNLLAGTIYSTDTRPVTNQSEPIVVSVSFSPVTILGVDDVSHSFVCNGFIAMQWMDSQLRWNASDYGGIERLYPHARRIWRPMIAILNTLDKRNPFEDNASPLIVHHTGLVTWHPGGLFRTFCDLDLERFPFDTQTCSIKVIPMNHELRDLVYVSGETFLVFFSQTGEWELIESSIDFHVTNIDTTSLSSFDINFIVKRRPSIFVLITIVPAILLSLLNMLVFVIPADSGEKVSYSITVVLALSVSLSIVSGMLPKSTNILPHVIVYLCGLLIISVLTVVDAVVIVFIFHLGKREENSGQCKVTCCTAGSSASELPRIVERRPTSAGPVSTQSENGGDAGTLKTLGSGNHVMAKEISRETMSVGKHGLISKYIDRVSFVLFLVMWLTVTVWYFISVF